MLARAEGLYYWTPEGRQVLDAASGLWCVNAGHGRKEITEAVAKQIAVLDYAPPFQMGHPIAFELANALVEITPQGARPRVLHELGLGVRGHGAQDRDRLPPRARRRRAHAPDRPRARLPRRRLRRHLRRRHGQQPQVLRRDAAGRRSPAPHARSGAELCTRRACPAHGAEFADDLERLVALHDASTIAAVIVEPIAGSTGVLLPPKGYLKRLRETVHEARHPAHIRRGHHRLRAHGLGLRVPGIRRRAGHHHLRQGTHERRRADGRGVREARDLRHLHVGPGRRRSSCSTATPIRRTRSPARPASRRWRSTAAKASSSARRRWRRTGRMPCTR